MATTQQVVQKLQDDIANGSLSAEDTVKLAAAITALSSNQTFEQALIAVAEGHFDTAVNALELAQADILTAKNTIATHADNLLLVPQLTTDLNNSLTASEARIDNSLAASFTRMDNLMAPVAKRARSGALASPSKKLISQSTNSDNRKGGLFSVIHDENTDSYYIDHSAYTYSTTLMEQVKKYSYQYDPAAGSLVTRNYIHVYNANITPDNFNRRCDSQDYSFTLPVANKAGDELNWITYISEYTAYRIIDFTSGSTLSAYFQWGRYAGVDKFGQNATTYKSVIYDEDTNTIIAIDSGGLIRRIYSDTVEVINGDNPIESTSLVSQGLADNGIVNFVNFYFNKCCSSSESVITEAMWGSAMMNYTNITGVGPYTSQGNNYHWVFGKDKKFSRRRMRMIPEVLDLESTSGTYNYTINSCNWHVVLEDYETNEILASVYFNERATDNVNHRDSTPSFAPWLLDITSNKMVMVRTGGNHVRARSPFGKPGTSNNYGGALEFSY
ncbi:hypothetical protein [Thalassomonas haliotis]|uniref:Tail fiber protein n=1 Tax=Thalassomonas haliotis TaxID=485448 RepID=A0ABY7VDJ4_9GAMM|nr:hypothetical protein [Thalassomonas haliotis]WDE11336.1 hypothetical protein H3N35_24460 [Thalassomonas haliotis]